MEKESLKTFNIITLWDSGVGKTSIINRYINNKFDHNIACTLGLTYAYKEIKFNNKDKIRLKLFDTAGQEKYRALSKSYFKNADAVLFVFNMNDKETFDTIKEWVESFKNVNVKGNVPQYLVGNKNDLERKIEQSLIEEFICKNNIPFISTSAKKNNKIDRLFEEIGQKLYIDFIKKEIKFKIILLLNI